MQNEYEKQANDFLKSTGTTLNVEFKQHGKHFPDDTEKRDIYTVTLKRGQRKYKFNFGQCTNDSITPEYRKQIKHLKAQLKKIAPSPYDILAALQSHEVGTFENFCGDFGYDNDSRKAEGIYKAVLDEYNNLKMLYSDSELEKLQEIC